MRTIKFKVIEQKIKNLDSVAYVYKGTDNYLNLKFEFDENWKDCVKAISFGSKGLSFLLKEDNSIPVPEEAFDENRLTFYLVGKTKDYRVQTRPFVIKLGG